MVTTVALLLAGGTGTRLYPASRPDRPKQFLSLGGDRPLVQEAADRLAFADETYAVTRERYAARLEELVPEATVLVEPEARDTGPALTYATHRIREEVGACRVFCAPTDHRIEGAFEPVARRALDAAGDGGLVTVGVEPDRPATGYGYIEPAADPGDGAAPVVAFREKPDADRAVDLVERGCLWNAGMLAFEPDAFLASARDSPLAPLVAALDDGNAREGFAAVDPVSVDYAVLERADDISVVRATFEWNDLGAWDALARVVDDTDGNTLLSEALTIDASGNVLASDGKHVSVVGVDDLVVAAYDDRVLVVPVDDTQRVRELVARLDEE